MHYIEQQRNLFLAPHSLRVRYEPCEGSMMIDLSTIRSLELIQNLHDTKSKHCLFGLLNQTLTPMGSRLLRSNILQPHLEPEFLMRRYDALEELTSRMDLFLAVRTALKGAKRLDVDRVLTTIVTIGSQRTVQEQWLEQSINYMLVLKSYVQSIGPIYEALRDARSDLLRNICLLCAPENYDAVTEMITRALNPDVRWASAPLELQNQRTYAVRSDVNNLLDVARTVYKEVRQDADEHCDELKGEMLLAVTVQFN